MNASVHRQLNRRKRRILRRIKNQPGVERHQPMMAASNIRYEIAEKARGIAPGGIGAIHLLAKKLGLVRDIDENLHLLKRHLPYHESDHVLNIAYNLLAGGSRLEHLEVRRNDEAYLDALGAQRLPDPTTAGDFCRRFSEADVGRLMDAFNETRLRAWKQQPADFLDEAFLDADGTMAPTLGWCKQGVDIAYNGVWGYHPLVVSLANTCEGCGRGYMWNLAVVTVIVRTPPPLAPHPGARPMAAAVVRRTDAGFTISVEVPYKSPMLDAEEAIQQAINKAGVAATQEALSRFDADGTPIRLGTTKLTSMGKVRKDYQTPYGVATVERHVYQGPGGGKVHCPLDQDARIVVSSTPRFAKVVAHKYAEFGAARVLEDLAENHGREVAKAFVQDVADAVATVALAKAEAWEYELPELEASVATVTIGLDGTCLLMCEGGWREAMVGTLGFYDAEGQRLHTVYTAATPEYGKLTSFGRLDREIDRAKSAYPDATYVGLADGARENWTYLEGETSVQVVDFFHAAGYVGKAADPLFAESEAGRRDWVDGWCHRLRHEAGAAAALIAELEARGAALGRKRLPAEVDSALTYLRNQVKGGRMDYAALTARHIPIGSGVTEAACKVLVKQRLCGSGMRWKERGAAAVLSVRCLTYTAGRWEQFWARVDRSGFPVAA